MNLPGTLPIIEAGHDLGRPVIVGGRGFGGDDTRAVRLGADGWGGALGDVAPLLERVRALGPDQLAAGAADVASCGELSAVRVPLSVELSERIAHRHFRQLPRGLRQPRQLRADVTNLLLFLEAAVLCDDRIFADYAVWLRDCVTARGARDQLVAAMLSTLHERLAIDVPSVDLPLHAASLALA